MKRDTTYGKHELFQVDLGR